MPLVRCSKSTQISTVTLSSNSHNFSFFFETFLPSRQHKIQIQIQQGQDMRTFTSQAGISHPFALLCWTFVLFLVSSEFCLQTFAASVDNEGDRHVDGAADNGDDAARYLRRKLENQMVGKIKRTESDLPLLIWLSPSEFS